MNVSKSDEEAKPLLIASGAPPSERLGRKKGQSCTMDSCWTTECHRRKNEFDY